MPDTYTAHYNFTKPEVNASRDTWGTKDNANWDDLDADLWALEQTKLSVIGGNVTGLVNFTGPTPQILGNIIAPKVYVDGLVATALINAQAYVDTEIASVRADMIDRVPPGMIMMWSGTIATIPTGWALCDGTNGTPDLEDKFIVGAGETYDPADTGGAATHDHGAVTGGTAITIAQMPSHTHTVSGTAASNGAHTHTVTDQFPEYNGDQLSGGAGARQPDSIVRTTSSSGAHTHTVSGTAAATGSGATHTHSIASASSLPPYYALAFIMKLPDT